MNKSTIETFIEYLRTAQIELREEGLPVTVDSIIGELEDKLDMFIYEPEKDPTIDRGIGSDEAHDNEGDGR